MPNGQKKTAHAGRENIRYGVAFLILLILLVVFLVVFLLAAFVGLSPAILVICAGCFGLAYQKIRKERPQ